MSSKNKALFMWGSVMVLVLAAALFDYQWEKRQDEQKQEATKLFNLDPSQVQLIDLVVETPTSITLDGVTAVSNRMRLEKKEDGWWLGAPLSEKASQNDVYEFLEGVVLERAVPVHIEGSSVDWGSFGLAEPRGSIELRDSAGKSEKVQVATRKNFQGEVYLRRNNDPEVRLGAATWTDKMNKTLTDFRDKRLLREPPMDVKTIAFKRGGQVLHFDRQEAKWSLREQSQWKLDQNRTREVLALVTNKSIVEFKRDGQFGPADLKEFGLDRPALEVEISLAGREHPWKAEVSALKDQKAYIALHEPSKIVAVSGMDAEKLLRLDPSALRDHHAPFDFDPAQVKNVEVHVGTRSKALSSEEASGLVKKLREFEVIDFMEPRKGLMPGGNSRIVLKSDDALLLSLSFSAPQKKKVRGEEKEVVMMTSNLSPEVMSIDVEKWQELDLAKLLEENKK